MLDVLFHLWPPETPQAATDPQPDAPVSDDEKRPQPGPPVDPEERKVSLDESVWSLAVVVGLEKSS